MPAGIWVNDMISVLQNGRELYFATNKGVYVFEK